MTALAEVPCPAGRAASIIYNKQDFDRRRGIFNRLYFFDMFEKVIHCFLFDEPPDRWSEFFCEAL